MATLPYLATPGNVTKAFTALQNAATPPRVTQDFVKTVLKIPGGSGDQMTTFLRRLGFVGADGAPTDLYRNYRNPSTAGRTMARAIKQTYSELGKFSEYFYLLSDKDLKGVIVQATGSAAESRSVSLTFSTLKQLISLADFDSQANDEGAIASIREAQHANDDHPRDRPNGASARSDSAPIGLTLGYTINLNLPATTDINVFNAIFKSIKSNLLKDDG